MHTGVENRTQSKGVSERKTDRERERDRERRRDRDGERDREREMERKKELQRLYLLFLLHVGLHSLSPLSLFSLFFFSSLSLSLSVGISGSGRAWDWFFMNWRWGQRGLSYWVDPSHQTAVLTTPNEYVEAEGAIKKQQTQESLISLMSRTPFYSIRTSLFFFHCKQDTSVCASNKRSVKAFCQEVSFIST